MVQTLRAMCIRRRLGFEGLWDGDRGCGRLSSRKGVKPSPTFAFLEQGKMW